jgi:transcriptional regulator with XRE-family HTH domain
MPTLGKRIKELRREKGLLQDDLAREIGVSKGTVSVWERDARKPEYDTLQQLCEYFQVNLGYLLGEDVDRALIQPSDDDLARWEKEDDQQILVGFVRRFLKLSPDMQDVVKQTLLAAYKFDKRRGALQNVGDEEIGEIAEKISDSEYWKTLDQDE